MLNKKGQDGKGVAILLLLIALFMVLYILLLPPEQRDQILNQTVEEDGSSSDGTVNEKMLLLENPGKVYPSQESDVTHEISPISLFIKAEPVTNKLADILEVSKSLFGSKPQKITFYVENTANLKDIILFFTVKDSKGNLVVKLNDNIIFDGVTTSVETIRLPVNYIKNKNILELQSSSPGILFWIKNYHILENVGIKEVYQISNPKEERIFSMPSYEKTGLEKATLNYQIYCNNLERDTTNLKIFLNTKNILDKFIGCAGNYETVEIDESYFKEGSNTMQFTIGEGDFQFSKISIKTELKESVYPTYHFNIDSEDFDSIQDNKAEVELRFIVSEDARKTARIMVNNKEIFMDVSEDEFVKSITSYVEDGDNMIKIIPQNTFYIDRLEVKLT